MDLFECRSVVGFDRWMDRELHTDLSKSEIWLVLTELLWSFYRRRGRSYGLSSGAPQLCQFLNLYTMEINVWIDCCPQILALSSLVDEEHWVSWLDHTYLGGSVCLDF